MRKTSGAKTPETDSGASCDGREPLAASEVMGESLVVFVACAFGLGILQWSQPWVAGVDGLFHMKMASLLRESGPVRDFPWADACLLRDHFSDSSFLFHALLTPFTFLANGITAVKASAVVFGSFFFAVFYGFLRSHRCRLPVIFLLLLVGSAGSLFLFRMCQSRAYLLSMVLALLAADSCLRNRPGRLAAISFVYPLTYTAFQVAPGIAALHNLAQFVTGSPLSRRLLPASVLGVATGLLVHPNFPQDLTLWWYQNVRVLTASWTSAPLDLGSELLPLDTRALLFYAPGYAAVLAGSLLLAVATARKRTTETVSLAFLTVAFGVMTLLSRRFMEYGAPFAVTFAAFLFRDTVKETDVDRFRAWAPRVRWPALVLAGLVLVGLLGASLGRAWTKMRDHGDYALGGAAAWLRDHTPPGDLVFQTAWEDFPELFFHNTSNRYLVALDPTFMHDRDPAKYRLWRQLTIGEAVDLHASIRWRFGARWVVTRNDKAAFLARVLRDSRFRRVYADDGASVLHLEEERDAVAEWAVCGPFSLAGPPADLRMRAAAKAGRFGTEAGLPLPLRHWSARLQGSYVDLRELLGLEGPAAAYALCRLRSPVKQNVNVLLGFAETVDLYLDGEPLPAPAAAATWGRSSHTLSFPILPGEHTLMVRCLGRAAEWGFSVGLSGASAPLEFLPSAEGTETPSRSRETIQTAP